MRLKFKSVLSTLVVVLALSGLTAASALASGAPIVETNPATFIRESKANLKGSVTANGATTKYYFDYGTTTAYGSKTPESVPLGKVASRNVAGLTRSTTYHFRVVATNSFGTSYGADEVFTTLAEKPEFAAKAGVNLATIEYKGQFGGADWENTNEDSFKCTEGSFNGILLGIKTVSGKIVFTGCEIETGQCKSEGAKAGEIATVQLEGTLVYISKAAKTVGLDLKPKSGEVLTSFKNCYSGQVTGSIIIPIGPINKLATKLETGTLRENRGIQEIAQYEYESGETEQGSLSTTWPSGSNGPLGWALPGIPLLTNKEVEIKA